MLCVHSDLLPIISHINSQMMKYHFLSPGFILTLVVEMRGKYMRLLLNTFYVLPASPQLNTEQEMKIFMNCKTNKTIIKQL